MLFSKLAMLLFAVTPLFVTTSCGKETPAPVVTLTEVGHENSHTATIGDEMHLEADIMADGLIKVIYVELHQEDGGYEIETSYTAGKYIGVRNTRFHEHIDIPTEPLPEITIYIFRLLTKRASRLRRRQGCTLAWSKESRAVLLPNGLNTMCGECSLPLLSVM